ncbi:hypothetical protein Ccrd_021263 [Cynara cardunculus var. scolymus]|uniref:E3 ubiquitin-protein ligase CHFR cysteine rich domain-containing protein n=1 Tax=Cynara cardunculus var. scolymus TaxID=59895 RepID=A0A103Y0W9_CYNCS|nr:hypothetical protein Ccrd_021263 [Cynara cardunculus var. scolymus]
MSIFLPNEATCNPFYEIKTLETTCEQATMEQGEGSGSKPSDEIWSKLVPSDSRYSDVELWSDEAEIRSEVKVSSFEKEGWCKITRNLDLSSAMLQNNSSNVISVDGTDVQTKDTIMIRCGSEIIPGPASEGYLSYRFKVMPMNESAKKVLKIPIMQNAAYEILQSDSSLRRSDKELAALNSYALIKSPFVIDNGKKSRRKRSRLQPEEDSLGCDRAFCGAYWHSQQVTRSDTHHMCALETFKPIAERTLTIIPFLAHERNRHEQDITERCILQMGKTLQNVVSEWITKSDKDATESYRDDYCRNTYLQLLPGDALQREDCWYGYTCRTQHHNEDHARKRNHVCRPTRGSIGN